MKQRTSAIARGELKPGAQIPRYGSPRRKCGADTFCEKPQVLGTIRRTSPQSLAELAKRTGRKKPNLSRTLKTMEHYGLVQISRHKRKLVPRVRYQRVAVLMELRG